MNKYRKDRNYFLSYFNINIVVFLTLNLLLLFAKKSFFDFNFSLELLLLIPVGCVFGLVVATAFHNASHGNIKPKTLNTIVGEFCGAFALDGMRNFRVGHMLHHIHADDEENDPHPPHGLSFLEFIKTSKDRTIQVLIREYYKHHGQTRESERNIELQLLSYKIGFLLKVTFWFLLFGPALFLLFYIPAFASYFFGFAHLNYISHGLNEEGESEVLNHDGGIFYSVMNFLTSGGYYHKNHHKYPKLYNPSRLDKLESHSNSKFRVYNPS
ncbi:fatty acid desaturase [Halobacteriovorax marinus]|uniref:fatty acid desaturase n=1 Tax=Halobacteriovorax marinus TaxID=97084 RepID=UPI003A92099C